MKRWFLAGLFLVVALGYGLAEDFWTNRRHSSADLERAVARLRQVPSTVGDWEGTDLELDARQIAQAEITGYVERRYVNQHGSTLTVLLICGRPGPTSLHTPEICYSGAGFAMRGPAVRKPIAEKGAADLGDFWVGRFQKSGPAPEGLQIYWAWNGTGNWQAADQPRFQFAPLAALYKLYVIREMSQTDLPGAEDTIVDFLEHFLPEVERALFAGSTAHGEQRRQKS